MSNRRAKRALYSPIFGRILRKSPVAVIFFIAPSVPRRPGRQRQNRRGTQPYPQHTSPQVTRLLQPSQVSVIVAHISDCRVRRRSHQILWLHLLADKPTFDPDDPSLTFFCGTSWAQADETCGMRCPSGNSLDCPAELECWAFTSCKEERGVETLAPAGDPTQAPFAITVPGYGGAQVPVFGGQDWSQFQPTDSNSPSASAVPSTHPTVPSAVAAAEMAATYWCGKDWMDVVSNCHQPCPGGNNIECETPGHSCWAFVHACKVETPPPTRKPVATMSPTKRPTRPPTQTTINKPTPDPGAPTTPQPTDPPTDLYGLLEGQTERFYCSATWDGITCGVSKPCPSGDGK